MAGFFTGSEDQARYRYAADFAFSQNLVSIGRNREISKAKTHSLSWRVRWHQASTSVCDQEENHDKMMDTALSRCVILYHHTFSMITISRCYSNPRPQLPC